MANPARDLVNERLYCCKLQLETYLQLNEQASLARRVIERLAGEAMIHHLYALYRSYLTELSLIYQGPERDFESASSLAAIMSEKGTQAAEINELLVLEADVDSWLSRLLGASTVVYRPVESQRLSQMGIPLVQLAAAEKVSSIGFLTGAYEAITQLIETQRALSEEW